MSDETMPTNEELRADYLNRTVDTILRRYLHDPDEAPDVRKVILTAAEPHIRRKVIEELAVEAESGHPDCLTPCCLGDDDDGWQAPLADWLRSRMPEVTK